MKLKKKKKVTKVKAPVPVIEPEDKEKFVELHQLLQEIDDELSGVIPTKEEENKQLLSQIKEKKEAARPPEQKAKKDLDNLVTIKELSVELKVEAKRLRKWLRANLERQDGRWEWPKGHEDIAKIKKAFSKK